MAESDLQRKLQDLSDEIERTETDDATKQASLNEIQDLIQKAMNEPDDQHKQSLRERLRKSLLSFEVEHPSLTANMETVSEYLSSLGI